MSKFQELMRELGEHRCKDCYGSGEQNDAEPGDTRFNKWTCPTCEGTGINPLYTISIYVGIAK
ncbi:hypothetical protein bas27_0096 [Escherichia phage TrudiGerster]|uniref:Antitermination protein Q n=1 Tax=Escherichia phage TrudiGerster TaxID=2851991 RepID=A0AAE7W0Y6_9CAUD|nr:hypothetical protein bas27_0096 [Escherichia phage TrudiGerster]